MIIQNFNDVDAIDLMEGVKKRIVIGKKGRSAQFYYENLRSGAGRLQSLS